MVLFFIIFFIFWSLFFGLMIFLCMVGSCPSCCLLREELNEACRSIACAKYILAIVNCKKSKLYDGLLILCDRYLSVEVNLWAVEGMKLVGEEVLFEDGKHHYYFSDNYLGESVCPLRG